MTGQGSGLLESPEIASRLAIHWSNRYAAAFGPFPSAIRPIRTPHLYERGDVILGCGGYDPQRSYLLLSKTRHAADHGADESGGVIAKVVSGRAVLDRWASGRPVTKSNRSWLGRHRVVRSRQATWASSLKTGCAL